MMIRTLRELDIAYPSVSRESDHFCESLYGIIY